MSSDEVFTAWGAFGHAVLVLASVGAMVACYLWVRRSLREFERDLESDDGWELESPPKRSKNPFVEPQGKFGQ